MLEDAAGIRRVVLACGVVDLRKGIDGLAMIIGDKYKQNPFERERCSYFVDDVPTGSKDCSGRERASCSCTNVLRTVGCHGHEPQKKQPN